MRHDTRLKLTSSIVAAGMLFHLSSIVRIEGGLDLEKTEPFERANARVPLTDTGGIKGLAAFPKVRIPAARTADEVCPFTPPGPPDSTSTADAAIDPVFADYVNVGFCAWGCFDPVYAYAIPGSVSKDQASGFGLVYSARRANIAPVIQIDATPASGQNTPDVMTLKVAIGGTALRHLDGNASDTIAYFTYADANKFTTRLAFQFDGNGYAPGAYAYTATVGFVRGAGTSTIPVTGRVLIADRDTVPYGAGWRPAGLQRLFLSADGLSAVITEADGSASNHRRSSTSVTTFTPPAGDHSTLTVSSGIYTRVYRDGSRARFDANGLMTAALNLYDDSTTFVWSGGLLTDVIDPAGYAIRLSYSGGRLEEARDTTNRRTKFAYNDAGELASIRI